MTAAGLLGVGTTVGQVDAASGYFGSNKHLRSDSPSGHQDVEPQIVSDASGTLYVGSIRGVPSGTDIWKSTDSGQSWQYLGQPDGLPAITGEPGGGDIAMAVGEPYSGSPGNLYVSSLYLGSLYFSVSSDGGQTWTTIDPVSSDIPGVDRQWLATEGSQTVYQSFHDLETGEIDVVKSTNGGLLFTQVAPAVDASHYGIALQDNELGNLVMDESAGRLYQIWAGPTDLQANVTGAPLNTLYMSISTNGGLTWSVNQIYTDPKGSVDHIFPIVDIDQAGNVYASWSDNDNIYYTASSDGGVSWTNPVQVNSGSGTKTSIFPWINGGSDGVLDVTWYATKASNNTKKNATWQVYWAQVTNALSSPSIDQVVASDHTIHTGPVCEGGTGCSGGRELADVFNMTITPDGYAHIAYTDDHDPNLPPQTYTASQISGPSAFQ